MRVETFEDAVLPAAAFDLGVCATAFHWLDEQAALAKVADALKAGGWWAMVWNVFGDPDRADPFHDATDALLNDGPRTPSHGGQARAESAQCASERASDAMAASRPIAHEQRPWELVLDPDQVVALYSTFSDMTARPADERRVVLAELRRIAAAPPFAAASSRNMSTVSGRRAAADGLASAPPAG